MYVYMHKYNFNQTAKIKTFRCLTKDLINYEV